MGLFRYPRPRYKIDVPVDPATVYAKEARREKWASVRVFLGLCIMLGSLYAGLQMMETKHEPQAEMPEGFGYAGSLASSHFLLMEASNVNNKAMQRQAAEVLCRDLGIPDTCEVYTFLDRRDIPAEFPIRRDPSMKMGYYRVRNGEKEFRLLHDGQSETEL